MYPCNDRLATLLQDLLMNAKHGEYLTQNWGDTNILLYPTQTSQQPTYIISPQFEFARQQRFRENPRYSETATICRIRSFACRCCKFRQYARQLSKTIHAQLIYTLGNCKWKNLPSIPHMLQHATQFVPWRTQSPRFVFFKINAPRRRVFRKNAHAKRITKSAYDTNWKHPNPWKAKTTLTTCQDSSNPHSIEIPSPRNIRVSNSHVVI